MSLPPEVKFAEAYFVVALPELRTMPFSALRAAMSAPPNVEVAAETGLSFARTSRISSGWSASSHHGSS